MAGAGLVGTYVGVEYQVPGPRVVHVRYLAAAVDVARPLSFVTVSPDQDEYEEDFADQNDFSAIHSATDHQTVPGVPPGVVYGFR